MMLSPKARLDAIPSVLVSADDVSASHGGTVGELDEAAIFYMQSRGLDRPAAVRVIVEGFFEPLIAELARRAAGGARAREDRRQARGGAARTSRPMPPVARAGVPSLASLDVKADFPIFARRFDDRRPAADLPRLGRDLAEARGRDRGARRASARPQRERPPRRVRAGAGGRRGLRRRARAGRRLRRGAAARRRYSRKNVTEAINLVAYLGSRANVGPGDAVLITQMEHHANIVPWQVLCRERGAELRYLEVDERGELSLEQLDAELARGDVRLVAFAHVSNVLGTIMPVAGDDRARARRGRGLAGGRRPGGAAHARRRRRDRRGLLRLDGPQGARADGHRRAARARRDPGADGAVLDRRRHDRLGRLPVGHLERAAVQVRGRHAADRRGRRAGRGGRLPVRAGYGRACARTSAR